MLLRFVSVSLLGFSFATLSLPTAARPEIASGDQWLDGVSQEECLTRVDAFISDLGIPSEIGDVDRTGYFDDGVFRILCYSGGPQASMVLIFTSHDESPEIATQFMQFALQTISQPGSTTSQSGTGELN